MKRLSRLKLHNVSIMNEAEMKAITGGAYYGPKCDIGKACSVTFIDTDYWHTTGSRTGNCQQKISGNSVTCFCDAVGYDTQLLNQSGISHCWVNK